MRKKVGLLVPLIGLRVVMAVLERNPSLSPALQVASSWRYQSEKPVVHTSVGRDGKIVVLAERDLVRTR